MTDDGTIQRTADGYTLRFVRQLTHPATAVWAALTEPDARAAWFFPGRLDLQAGGTVELTDSAHGIRGRTLAVDPPRLLEFTWDSKDAPGESVVRFELAPTPGGCALTFTHTVTVAANPDRLAAGWHMLLDALARHLAGSATTSGAVQSADTTWTDHYTRYSEQVARP
jgi:uncharacterized protein YndB with AHSA1/START domain